MTDKCKIALDAIEIKRLAFRKAENEAIETMTLVLKKAGEYGVDICPCDHTDNIFVAVAEVEASIFEPISLVRYWEDRLEVFIPEHKRDGEQGWEILPGGRWVDYFKAHVDTWFMLDLISDNLEYAEGYYAE